MSSLAPVESDKDISAAERTDALRAGDQKMPLHSPLLRPAPDSTHDLAARHKPDSAAKGLKLEQSNALPRTESKYEQVKRSRLMAYLGSDLPHIPESVEATGKEDIVRKALPDYRAGSLLPNYVGIDHTKEIGEALARRRSMSSQECRRSAGDSPLYVQSSGTLSPWNYTPFSVNSQSTPYSLNSQSPGISSFWNRSPAKPSLWMSSPGPPLSHDQTPWNPRLLHPLFGESSLSVSPATVGYHRPSAVTMSSKSECIDSKSNIIKLSTIPADSGVKSERPMEISTWPPSGDSEEAAGSQVGVTSHSNDIERGTQSGSDEDYKPHTMSRSSPELQMKISCPDCEALFAYHVQNFSHHLKTEHAWESSRVENYKQYLHTWFTEVSTSVGSRAVEGRIIPPNRCQMSKLGGDISESGPVLPLEIASKSQADTDTDVVLPQRLDDRDSDDDKDDDDETSWGSQGSQVNVSVLALCKSLARIRSAELTEGNDSHDLRKSHRTSQTPKQVISDASTGVTNAIGSSGTSSGTIGTDETCREKGKSKGKRKRQDDDDSADESKRDKSRKRMTVGTALLAGDKLFACPFWKADRIQYSACGQIVMRDSTAVKFHLQRCRRHAMPVHCDRCLIQFKSLEAKRVHNKGSSCKPENRPVWSGITRDQRDELSVPFKDNDDEARWYEIWNILSFDVARPESPYLDDMESAELIRLQQTFDLWGPHVLPDILRAHSLPPSLGLSTEQFDEFRYVCLQRFVRTVLGRHSNTYRGPSTPADEPQGAARSSNFQGNGEGSSRFVSSPMLIIRPPVFTLESDLERGRPVLAENGLDTAQSSSSVLDSSDLHSELPVLSPGQDQLSSSLTSSLMNDSPQREMPRDSGTIQYANLLSTSPNLSSTPVSWWDSWANNLETVGSPLLDLPVGVIDKAKLHEAANVSSSGDLLMGESSNELLNPQMM